MILPHRKPPSSIITPRGSNQVPTPLLHQPASRPRLVVADDNQLLRDILTAHLTKEGYTVRGAEDGEAAWKSLTAEPFDLLVTDLEMPYLNGFELIRRMRTNDLAQPAILVSGNLPVMTPDMVALLNPGDALAKPFTLPDLLQKIWSLLAGTGSSRKTPHGSPLASSL